MEEPIGYNRDLRNNAKRRKRKSTREIDNIKKKEKEKTSSQRL